MFDLIEFLIHYVRFGYPGNEHSDLAMLFLTIIFLSFDIFYIAWAVQARGKFPGGLSETITKALFGSMEKINLELKTNVRASVSKMIKRKK